MKELAKFIGGTIGVIVGLSLGLTPFLLVALLRPGLAETGPWTLLLCTVVFALTTVGGALVGPQLGARLFYKWRGW